MSKQLDLKDNRTTIKWCNEKGIEIHSIGKKKLVNQFLINIEIDRNFISSLKKDYPIHWKKLYKYYSNGDKTSYILLLDRISSQKDLSKPYSNKSIQKIPDKNIPKQNKPKVIKINNRRQAEIYVPKSSLAASLASS